MARKAMVWVGLLAAALWLYPAVGADSVSTAVQHGWTWLGEANRSRSQRHAQAHYHALITAVSDGDSIRATDTAGGKHKIRLAYIDAPEIEQAHGQTSRDVLRALLLGQKADITVFEHDQYGREVAQVRVNGQDVNLKQLEEGHAWHYISIAKRKQNKLDYAEYADAEAQAKQARTGLWRGKAPLAPWTFRKEQRATRQHHAPKP